MRQAQKVGPEFCFRYDNQARLQPPQIWPNGKSKIEGKVKDRTLTKAATSQVLPGIRSGGDDNPMARKLLLQFADQLSDGKDFSDGNGVNPDGIARVVSKPVRNLAQSFAKPGAIFSMTQVLEQPIWKAQEQPRRQQRAIKQVHGEVTF